MKWLADLLEGSLSPEMTLKILAAALAGIPLFFGGFGSLIAGIISSRLIARTGASRSSGARLDSSASRARRPC